MTPTLTPNLEPIAVPGRISGTSIIDDLLNRIAEKLSKSCDLRAIDAYSGYAAKVEITLQLVDVYPVEVTATVEAGDFNSQLPSVHISLGGEVSAEAAEPSLERPIDPDGVTEVATPSVATAKRYYTPRNAVPLGTSRR